MQEVFVLCNQHQQYFTKAGEWISAGDSRSLYRSSFRDEVVNEKVEISVKNPELRITVVSALEDSSARICFHDGEFPVANADSDTAVLNEES